MIITEPAQADAVVLRHLAERGPGPTTLKEIAAATGLPRITVRTAMYALNHRGAACFNEHIGDYGCTRYLIRHVHPDVPGEDPDGTVSG